MRHSAEQDASTYGPACVQPPAFLAQQLNKTVDEHCLYLNVFAPRAAFESKKPLPVLFYIHGGAFLFGSGSASFVNPRMYTQHDVILVSINYRLDLLGFIALPNIPYTNFGLLDQRTALEWVHENIASFGGDTQRITAIGDSAGAISILHHITSPLHIKKPLFHRAILISAGLFAGPDLTIARAQRQHLKIARERLGCPGDANAVLACLKKLPVTDMRVHYTRMPTPFIATYPMESRITGAPIDDGTYFPNLIESLQKGNFDRNIPVIVGTDLDEGTMFASMSYPLVYPDETYFRAILEQLFGANVSKKIIDRYGPERTGSLRKSVDAVTSHLFTSHGTCHIARFLSQHSNAPIYRYGNYHMFEYANNKDLGVFHTAAHALLLRPNIPEMLLFPSNYTEAEIELSQAFGSLLMQFASVKSPADVPGAKNTEVKENDKSKPFPLFSPKQWPAFTSKGLDELHIGPNQSSKLVLGSRFQAEDCEFWNSLFPPHGLVPPVFNGDLYEKEPLLAHIANEGFWIVVTYLRLVRNISLIVLVSIGLGILYCIRPRKNAPKAAQKKPAGEKAKKD